MFGRGAQCIYPMMARALFKAGEAPETLLTMREALVAEWRKK
jgi:hypothetical protein